MNVFLASYCIIYDQLQSNNRVLEWDANRHRGMGRPVFGDCCVVNGRNGGGTGEGKAIVSCTVSARGGRRRHATPATAAVGHSDDGRRYGERWITNGR